MATNAPLRRLVLRAVVHHAGGTIFTHTLEVGEERLAVACTTAFAHGTPLRVILSFPKLVDEIEIEARVADYRADDGYGREAAVICDIVSTSERGADSLRRLAMESTTMRAAAPAGPLRCLLVEDNSFIRDLFSYGMHKYGRARGSRISLDAAPDADQAWSMLRAHVYDLAIIDHYLPTQNGSHLIARIRDDAQLAGILVVAISVGGGEARQASMDAGADLFLDKPIVMRDLFSTLDRLTRGSETP